MAGGRYVASSKARDFAILAKARYAKRVVVEATVVLQKAMGTEWKTAGVAVVLDERNYWHFAFVESPDKQGKRHFVELCEMLDGVWLSQSEPATRLSELESLNPDFNWQYGHPYRVRIELSEREIGGTLCELDGRVLGRRRYRLDNKAVRFGRPALTCGGFVAAFDDVVVRSQNAVPAPEQTKRRFPPYTQAGRGPLPREPKGKATGFFHVEEHDDRWWVIDPKGRPFFIIGTDHANYRVHWCEKLGYAPYHRNMAKRFDGDEQKWAASTAERLLAWGFNSLGANHSPSLRYRGLAWMGFVSFGSGFASISDICPKVHWTGFPNVFHPRFALYCEKRARQLCAPFRNDPWLLGYFLDNELEWYGKEHRDWSLCDEVFKKPAAHSGKRALIAFLRKRYPTIEQLNEAWGTRVASYEALTASTEPLRHRTERGRADKIDFVRLVAERYFAITTAAIRKHDPNHMILGCRFAGRLPPIGEIAGKYCDIFSINCYRWVDLETGIVRGFEDDLKKWYDKVKRPFMITEWSFPALDSGLPCKHGAGQRFDTQAQRARAFTIFQKLLFSTPFMAGSDYFMWVDEPALGISSTFPEDSNYGLVNVHNEPYKPLVEAAARVHPRVYAIHAGQVPELSVSIEKAPWRVVVKNTGDAEGRTEVEITINSRRTRRAVRVPAGGTTTLSIEDDMRAFLRPGVGVGQREVEGRLACVLRVTADPDQKLAEVNRRDNVALNVHVDWPAYELPEKLRWKPGEPLFAGVPIVVANPTQDPLRSVPVAAPLRQLPHGGALEKAAKVALLMGPGVPKQDIGAPKEAWRQAAAQLDRLPSGTDIVFLAPQIPPFTARVYTALLMDESARIKAGKGSVRFAQDENGWRVDNGVLQLIKQRAGGNAFDKVLLRGKELGRFVPVIWQDVGQNLWPQPDSAKVVGVSNGPIRLVLDVEFELKPKSKQPVRTAVDEKGKYARVQTGPGAFRTRYRFYVYPNKPWFGARFLWLENTDPRPWGFQAYFHYALSSLAGQAGDDVVGGPDVPNYYRRDQFVMWSDLKAKLHYGICAGRPTDFQMLFWKDPGGGQHADVRREVRKRLKPGERYAEPQPIAYVFGASGANDRRAWATIVEQIRRWETVQVKVFPLAGKR